MIETEEIEKRLNEDRDEWTLLDVRDADERAEASIDGNAGKNSIDHVTIP